MAVSRSKAEKAKALVEKMTLEEKASILSGLNFWYSKPVERLGLPSFMLTDGPHGVRKQGSAVDHLGINQSVQATCFPPAATSACSFDRALLREMGLALGEECLENEVGILLGPAANIKRSPLCGRNFEYFSEDPYLSGECAAAFIEGVQSKNVGTSMKHFLANSQERLRMVSDSVIDKRALHEIYLRAFEIAVKKAQPWTIMCSYNKINGTYAAENKEIMTDLLRDKWGFNGAVVTDWGAMNDRIKGIEAGIDLEMPACDGFTDRQLVKAVEEKKLDEGLLDRSAERMTNIALMHMDNRRIGYETAWHNKLARRIARESAVLLKNDGLLPVIKDSVVAMVGAFAKEPRYQGAGSSKINPTQITNVFDEFADRGLTFSYSQGYDLEGSEPNERLIEEACIAAKSADVVFVFVGLPDNYESEGSDRKHLNMPESHTVLIERLCKVNKNVAVVLETGSPVEMPWIELPAAVLLMGLTGQNNGGACYDLLFGDFSPCGKLAETYPLKIEDTPAYNNFSTGDRIIKYKESIYVGYRYYDKAEKEVLFPFGHGLSYTTFKYSGLRISSLRIKDTEAVTLTARITNMGKKKAKEIVQLYVSKEEDKLFRAKRELRDFTKVELDRGESRDVSFTLGKEAFSYYNTQKEEFCVEEGSYKLELAASSRDIRLSTLVFVGSGDEAAPDFRETCKSYYGRVGSLSETSDEEFEGLLGYCPPKESKVRPFSKNSTISDIRSSIIGRTIAAISSSVMVKTMGGNGPEMQKMVKNMLYEMPLRAMIMGSNGLLNLTKVEGLVMLMNRKPIKGMKLLFKKEKIKKEEKKTEKGEATVVEEGRK